MITRTQFAIALARREFAVRPRLVPVRHNRAVYSMDMSNIVGQNVGSIVRPEIVKVDPKTKTETVDMFLARGGQITKGAPCMRGYAAPVVKSKPTRFAVSRG